MPYRTGTRAAARRAARSFEGAPGRRRRPFLKLCGPIRRARQLRFTRPGRPLLFGSTEKRLPGRAATEIA